MSHIHIPDGVLPLWLIALGWLVAGALIGLAVVLLRGETTRRVPLLGVMAAVMLVGMSTEIVPIAYHVNLAVLAGIVLGPAYSLLAAFIVNLILAMLGHGGITVVGLNTLVIAAEAVAGYYLFRLLLRLLRRLRPAASPSLAAGAAAVFALFLSTSLLVGIVWASGVNPGEARETGTLDPGTLSFSNPFEDGLIANRVVSAEAGEEGEPRASGVDVITFAKVVFLLGFLGWIVEALITGAIVGFVHQVRPDLVRTQRRENRRLPIG